MNSLNPTDGSDLVCSPTLARRIDEPFAGADGRNAGEPSPFVAGSELGRLRAICAVVRLRPDAGKAGVSAMEKGPIDGPVAIDALGVRGDLQGDRYHHGGPDKAVYALAGSEVDHWAAELGLDHPGLLGENLVVDGDLDDLEPGSRIRIEGVPGPNGEDRSVLLEARSIRNPCSTLARGVARPGFAAEFASRNRVGILFSVLREGVVEAGARITVESVPGHGVTCRRWFAHHDPSDAALILASEERSDMEIAPALRPYLLRSVEDGARIVTSSMKD
ncbi:MOSC domain-containing protein [Actinomyces culturomici]|uniref:MOSC domain-containing protein n=1 Tax=Actinomyces culturomici TaxID=1926276 RepID=UPI000E20157C|nr:MOSC domain-containing protein [Actinomyces culturomici]